ncbi:hypothetical protein FSHL1_006491 [Fusarium sambucinum]
MLNPLPENSNCGAIGHPTTLQPESVLSEGDSSSLEACRDECNALSGCKSVSFELGNNCALIADSAIEHDGANTEWTFYNMSCFCEETT